MAHFDCFKQGKTGSLRKKRFLYLTLCQSSATVYIHPLSFSMTDHTSPKQKQHTLKVIIISAIINLHYLCGTILKRALENPKKRLMDQTQRII